MLRFLSPLHKDKEKEQHATNSFAGSHIWGLDSELGNLLVFQTPFPSICKMVETAGSNVQTTRLTNQLINQRSVSIKQGQSGPHTFCFQVTLVANQINPSPKDRTVCNKDRGCPKIFGNQKQNRKWRLTSHLGQCGQGPEVPHDILAHKVEDLRRNSASFWQ